MGQTAAGAKSAGRGRKKNTREIYGGVYPINRQKHIVTIGNIKIGGSNPVAVQSMTKTNTSDVKATVKQIRALEAAGCQIVRCAVRDEEDAKAITAIKKAISIPLVADIHFNHKLAIMAAQAGADKLRINPGNIGDRQKVAAVVAAARERKIPIRVGVNSGSLEKEIKARYKHATAEALAQSALDNVKRLEDLGFHDIVISAKSTSVPVMISAYEILSKKTRHPLHVGVTEAGIPSVGVVRSAVGIGALLAAGIGDTIRVSLTADPVEEVKVAYEILKSLELSKKGVILISCPTCGRCAINIQKITQEIEKRTKDIVAPIKIAIMGCEVNGPGEAGDADVGLAGGRGVGLIFRKGQVIKKVDEAEMIDALLAEISKEVKDHDR